ncbi:MAG: mannose-1-phosphate guanylyltransferase/mannose-6-phosphate isomerase [Pseudomonas sp.]|uniref:mannose-1-phosphate guanylyltransferase/mannose-6-phosphate isomerase n=1 Tax=Pseudomonas sp. TaxID=306 RepID=UPI003D0A94A2
MIPLILSGGSGSRLWPLSRTHYPKQFLALEQQHSMLQQTVQRLPDGMQAPIVVCNDAHRFIVREQLDAIGCHPQAILLEPAGRNTAPAVAVAAMHLLAQGRDELLLALPADHVIDDLARFHAALEAAGKAAGHGEMALFGIPAEKPETGYGYIKVGPASAGAPSGTLPVERFVEKPDLTSAQGFVTQGGYFWNSGMFLFRCSHYLDALQRHAPNIYAACQTALQRSSEDLGFIRLDPEAFEQCPADSIDYAVMEKTERACMVPLAAGWNDIGSWSALWEVQGKDENGNVQSGDVLVQDSHNCLVHSQSKLVTLVGLDDVVVVETRDAVLVAYKDRAQEVKQLVNTLDAQNRPEAHSHSLVYRPWGSYSTLDSGPRFQVKRLVIKPGASLSLQRHQHRAEHWVVVSGTALVTCDDSTFLLTENQSTYIPMAALHRLSNPGRIPLEIIEVQSGSYLGEDDIERFDDAYGRTDALPQGTVQS